MTNIARLSKQIEFIVEIDKLKNIFRQSFITDQSRRENDAEHSWHIAVMAILLVEHANKPDIDVLRVVKMLLIHDIVEIDAGDTFVYDTKGYEDKKARENAAANRLFSILPNEQCNDFFELWNEFEANQTDEAHFANALDRVQPILLNYICEGKTWKEHAIKYEQALKRNEIIQWGSETLWEFIQKIFDDSKAKGYLQ